MAKYRASTARAEATTELPDFRNLGAILRIALLVNALAAAFSAASNQYWVLLPQELLEHAALVEPTLFMALAALYVLQPSIARLSLRAARGLVLLVSTLCALGMAHLLSAVVGPTDPARVALWSASGAIAVLFYFSIRAQAITPALTEARLMALTARIRPHFLFNSINAVLGVIRTDPRRAETALEEMSDLFRVLMRENKSLVTLGEELELCRQYLELERLRLGERLQVRWDEGNCPRDALVPPLMLQPLLENAVYHGVEPGVGPGTVSVKLSHTPAGIVIDIGNPHHGAKSNSTGNRMALENIRERLELFYDLEASLDTEITGGQYRVRLRFPYRRSRA